MFGGGGQYQLGLTVNFLYLPTRPGCCCPGSSRFFKKKCGGDGPLLPGSCGPGKLMCFRKFKEINLLEASDFMRTVDKVTSRLITDHDNRIN